VALSTRAKVELRRSGYPLPQKPRTASAATSTTPTGGTPRKGSFLSSLFRRP